MGRCYSFYECSLSSPFFDLSLYPSLNFKSISNSIPFCEPLSKRRATYISCHSRTKRNRRVMTEIPKQKITSPTNPSTTRVYVLSDIHSDYSENMNWVRELSSTDYKYDTLIVPGDVADSFQTFSSTMLLLKERFQNVFFIPGNHDLWCKSTEEHSNSNEKLKLILKFCKDNDIYTVPKKINEVWIVPLFSWHHQCFDKEPDIEGFNIPPVDKASMDYKVCKWENPLSNYDTSLSQYFDSFNDEIFKNMSCYDDDSPIISFSHFLPRYELCPEKRMLFYPHLPKISGSDFLESRIRSLHSRTKPGLSCHVFGHTHFAWDSTLDGIRYIQAPLAYPKERQRKINGGNEWLPLLLFDSVSGFVGPLTCHWSDYYRTKPRDPSNQTFAPWVEKLYKPVI